MGANTQIISRYGSKYHRIAHRVSGHGLTTWTTVCGLTIESHFAYETAIACTCEKCKRKEKKDAN